MLKEDIAAIPILRVTGQHIRIGVADVGDAISREDYAVDRAIPIVPRREIVAQAQAGFGVGGVHRIQAVDGVDDAVAILDRGRLDDRPGPIGVGDDRDPIVGVELIDQCHQAVLHHLHLVVFAHRAGHIDDKREQRVFTLPARDVLALNADFDQIRAFRREGRRRTFQVNAKGT